MKNRYKVVLPIEVDGVIYQHGATVELNAEQATDYSHALQALAKEEGVKEDGRDS